MKFPIVARGLMDDSVLLLINVWLGCLKNIKKKLLLGPKNYKNILNIFWNMPIKKSN